MRVVLTGAGGLLGTSIIDAWKDLRPNAELVPLRRADLDLRDRDRVREVFADLRPDAVIHAAAQVGGIQAKLAHPLRYLLDNLLMDSAVIEAAVAAEVPSLVYLASAAAYPVDAPQPLVPEALGTGALEPANASYGMAKLTGIRLCELASLEHGHAYRAVLPSNLYGPGDHFDAQAGHLVAAVLKKTHDAKIAGDEEVVIWGDGLSRRELVFAPDLARWLISELDSARDWPAALNLGADEDESIARFYELAAEIVGFRGRLVHDLDKPNGARRRQLDSAPARELGWNPPTTLRSGMTQCYEAFLTTLEEVR